MEGGGRGRRDEGRGRRDGGERERMEGWRGEEGDGGMEGEGKVLMEGEGKGLIEVMWCWASSPCLGQHLSSIPVTYPHCRLVFVCPHCHALVPCSFPVWVMVLSSCIVVMHHFCMWLLHTINSNERRPMLLFIVWCLMSASWVGMKLGWGVLTVVLYCHSSFGCHVTSSNLAPGFH